MARLFILAALTVLAACDALPVGAELRFACADDQGCVDGWRCGPDRECTAPGVPVDDVDDGAPPIQGDGGAARDGGVRADDGGARADDGGVPAGDGGASLVDGGSPMDDGGAAFDGGGPAEDGGIAPNDSGAPADDAGPSPVDAGFVCGDGQLDPGEECDDGDTTDRDGCASDCRAWWDIALPTRARFTLDSPAAAEVEDAPVALTIPADWLPGTPGDAYCVVAADHATVLPLDVERAATPGTSALLWTRVAALPPGPVDVYVYFGVDAACAAVPADVWAGRYEAVFHMENDVDAAGGATLTDAMNGPSAAGGRRGAGAGVDSAGWPRSPPTGLWFTGDVTLEAWGKLDAFGAATDWENTLVQATGGGAAQAYFFNVENDGKLRVYWERSTGGATDFESTAVFSLATSAWHHYAMVRDATANVVRFYVDGEQLGDAVAYTSDALSTAADTSFINVGGNATGSGTRHFDGVLDEVRIAGRTHSAEFIAVSHASTAGTLVIDAVLE